MTQPVSLIPIRSTDVSVGIPLPWPVYDWHGKLLMPQGSVIHKAEELQQLVDTGFFHDPTLDLDFSPPRVSAAAQAEEKKASGPPPALETVVAMHDVHWYVGETLYLQQLDNPAVRHTVKMIGFVPNKTVMVTAPVADGQYAFIRDGQTFVIRAFSGKNAYAFIADAVKSMHVPHPYLHLSYPKQVRSTVVRQGIRVAVSVIAAIAMGMTGRTGAATITDLSVGGASANIKEQLGKVGDEGRIKFKLQVAGHEELLNVKVILRALSVSQSGEGFRHGLEFVDLTPQDKVVLSAFVHQSFVDNE